VSRILIRHADVLATMDDSGGEAGREIADGAIAFENGVITAVGTSAQLAPLADGAEVIEAAGCVITPGLVNTHHHLYQSLTRAVPGCASSSLFGWLKTLYPIWARYTPQDIFTATRLGLAELALSGCTLTSDHLYLFPNGARLDDSIAAAGEIGIRLHATRGAMSVGKARAAAPMRWWSARTPSWPTPSA
jgi:cytosine/adenosine deaminase-related metal-dependent hydrolase